MGGDNYNKKKTRNHVLPDKQGTLFFVFFTSLLMLTTPVVHAATSVSQYGITWSFDGDYRVGQFANGDYWVVGPVSITSMSPNFDGSKNGWEVNPVSNRRQGFDANCRQFDASLVPSLPYNALPGDSIVKSISSGRTRPCLQTAAVLTVLAAPPPDNGATLFRPPYVGNDKPFYSLNDLHTDLLPSYAPVPATLSLGWVRKRFERVQLDHEQGGMGRFIHPVDNMPNYGADIAKDTGDGALRLMLNDPISDKMPALIAYIQYGIDLYHAVLNGQTWPSGGGHQPGRKLPLTFAAVMLDNQRMKAVIRDATFFHEDRGVYHSDKAGRALYGFRGGREEKYWNTVRTYSGFKAARDPYGYIDGGGRPVTGSYQFCCTSQPWKGAALALHLMPALKTVWNNPVFFDYVDRWVNFGGWTQPDPCAPAKGSYGVDYGPDGKGGCIKDTDPSDGIGRFPKVHGTNADGGHRYSKFQAAMWNAYRGRTPGAPPSPPRNLKLSPR